MYKGRETDPVGRGVEVAEVKDRDTTPNKLEKEIGDQLTKQGLIKVRPLLKELFKIYKEFKKKAQY